MVEHRGAAGGHVGQAGLGPSVSYLTAPLCSARAHAVHRQLYPVGISSYTKPKGKAPDYTEPVVLRTGKSTVGHFAE
jgi:hypothetical protein